MNAANLWAVEAVFTCTHCCKSCKVVLPPLTYVKYTYSTRFLQAICISLEALVYCLSQAWFEHQPNTLADVQTYEPCWVDQRKHIYPDPELWYTLQWCMGHTARLPHHNRWRWELGLVVVERMCIQRLALNSHLSSGFWLVTDIEDSNHWCFTKSHGYHEGVLLHPFKWYTKVIHWGLHTNAQGMRVECNEIYHQVFPAQCCYNWLNYPAVYKCLWQSRYKTSWYSKIARVVGSNPTRGE